MSFTPDDALDLLPMLPPGRTRTERVTVQLSALGRLPRTARLRRATETRRDHWLERETLVAVVRAFRRAGDTDAAGRVLDVLLRRLRPAVAARVREWRTLPPMDMEDAEGQAMLMLTGHVNSLAPGDAFWECNFTGAFNARLITLLKRLTSKHVAATSATALGADGEEWDRLAGVPDPAVLDAYAGVEARALIADLSGADSRLGEMLYLSLEGDTDLEIAARLGVTDRTLRHWRARLRTRYLQMNLP